MRGSEPYRQCWCRDPATGKPLRAKCPKLKNKKHGKWYARYDAGGTEGKRRQPVVVVEARGEEPVGLAGKRLADAFPDP